MRIRRLALALGAVLLLGLPALVFVLRQPVLVITDAPFAPVYGIQRIKRQQLSASLILFRRVKPVMIADGAGVDVILFAIGEAASRPYCVLFPSRFADGARRYRQQFPEIPVLLMENRGSKFVVGAPDENALGDLFIFKTDTRADLYRAGRCAAVLDAGKTGNIIVFSDQSLQNEGRAAFLAGFAEQGNEKTPQFLSYFAQFSGIPDISCVVLAGSGAEYLEQNREFPVILFSWLNPALTSREVVVIFDDSPWALVVPAVRMSARQQGGGQIPSKVVIFSARIADKGILRKLKKAAAALREGGRNFS
jgi:hypothetical protein